ncbi:hypothetical protein FH972_022672 [Carpinus fangiana]|uniref:EB1 C-terminal domain-containing protein n=1 Tax=Carpinus fangiana TaxID=176857 RepID=A0A5N6KSW8_9ROSI|nr:hypothetical protein FH972_022672 [Carpinus fangiana]
MAIPHIALFMFIVTTWAQGFTGPSHSDSSGPGASSGRSGGAGGLDQIPPQFVQFLPYSMHKLHAMYIAHGVLAGVAFVVFFPMGAILQRVLPGRLGLVAHVVCQSAAHVLYAVGFGIGIYYTHKIKFGRWALPVLGWVHHRYFKKTGKRTAWTHTHLWLGRGLIILGMTNGGLGLKLANATKGATVGYAVVAGVVGFGWLASATVSEINRRKRRRGFPPPAYDTTGDNKEPLHVSTEQAEPASRQQHGKGNLRQGSRDSVRQTCSSSNEYKAREAKSSQVPGPAAAGRHQVCTKAPHSAVAVLSTALPCALVPSTRRVTSFTSSHPRAPSGSVDPCLPTVTRLQLGAQHGGITVPRTPNTTYPSTHPLTRLLSSAALCQIYDSIFRTFLLAVPNHEVSHADLFQSISRCSASSSTPIPSTCTYRTSKSYKASPPPLPSIQSALLTLVATDCFTKHQIERIVPVEALIKCKMQDNLEFLQWTKRYWDQHFPGIDYDPTSRRKGSGAPPATGGGGFARSTNSAAGARRPAGGPAAAPRLGGARTGSAAGGSAANAAIQQENAALKETVAGLERERDFYFNKLRDIELLLQTEVEKNPELEAEEGGLVPQLQAILYSTEEGFEIPAEDGEEALGAEEETF